ncbi:uncharacterized protein LOC124847586 [Vigna umbellata]|uniref:uncharacterized protein LOC124847586 n=1 Tax=Vigna umbellata TaxID=87088 RepID=UPI001F5EE5F4|nr:uncharacterized protein LOC124847586 [Vigna umbellata]
MAARTLFIKPKRGDSPPSSLRSFVGEELIKMEQLPENRSEAKRLAPPQGIHQSDVDEDDENVNQLNECSSLYRLMQVNFIVFVNYLFYLPKTLNPQI